MILLLTKLLLEILLAFLLGTIVFDFVHYFFHYCLKSKSYYLRMLGALHKSHHLFFSPALKIEDKWAQQNILHHVIIEYLVQVGVILSCAAFLDIHAVIIAALLQTMIFAIVCVREGRDPHHKPYDRLPASRGGMWVSAEYHAMHHAYPTGYFSSYIKVLDYVFGTGHHLKGKHIAMTGSSGALGSAMKKLLEKEGAQVTTFKYGVDYDYDNYEKLRAPLSETDILFLCHGTKYDNTEAANCESYLKIIEVFRTARKPGLLPCEIWGTGSEIECHPCFGIKKLYPYATSKRHYARYARLMFQDKNIQYRHLVHSAFISSMGPGLMTANFAAWMTLFLIKRDFKYVPVSYTGFAWLNYLRFYFVV
jgi:sterol desaturase/sphingolipid hydroxylase (fatty acid hydroxylase superfamily)